MARGRSKSQTLTPEAGQEDSEGGQDELFVGHLHIHRRVKGAGLMIVFRSEF